MAAAATDLLQEVGIASATTLDSPGYTIGDTSITVVSVSTWPTATGITFAMDEVDAAGVQVAGTYNEYVGVKASATSITNVSHQNGTNQNYTAGATTRVYIPVSAERENRIVEWGLTEHEQDGTHAVELITSRTEDTNPDPDADFLLTYDTSASALKKVKPSNLSGGLTGWTPNVLPSVSSVTNNGNRSYDVTFGSTVASYLTPGMRVRTSRTVAAPTQCADLEAGSSQYFNDTSVSGMTFTDDFVVSAWVKAESYGDLSIASRYNGTSGWKFALTTSGQVALVGYNAGAANLSYVTSYQSIPLGKWVHIAAQLDMSAFTATTTTSYVMIDGVDVPATVTRGGTNPTALIQAGDLNIGADNSLRFFDGKIAQVAIYSAKVTQANIRATISQGLSGSETSLVSAYSFNNSINDLNANANNLTAQGSAVATNADSPFTVDANGVVGGTYDFGIVTKVATTTATVQVPEGCTIPTSGGVSAVDLANSKAPYGFPADEGRWEVVSLYLAQGTQVTISSLNQYYSLLAQLTVPIGSWELGYEGPVQGAAAISYTHGGVLLAPATPTNADRKLELYNLMFIGASTTNLLLSASRKSEITLSSATAYLLYGETITNSGATTMFYRGDLGYFIIKSKFALL